MKQPQPAYTNGDQLRQNLLQQRLELEREREKEAEASTRKGVFHSAPRFPEFSLDVFLKLTGLRKRGEANARDFQLRELALSFEDLPPAFDGFRILHLSDIHFWEEDAEFTDKLCAFLESVEADFCAFTGDYRFAFTGPYGHVLEGMQCLLDSIRPTRGSAAVLGNHDIAAFVGPFGEMGLPILMNEGFALESGQDRIWIAGVDDPHRYQCDNLPLALENVPRENFTILLAHTPELAVSASECGVDLYLCGHTHCGQVCLPTGHAVVTNTRAPRKFCFRQWRNGPTQGYTSPGLGTTDIPVRFYCPPEATIIRLERAD